MRRTLFSAIVLLTTFGTPVVAQGGRPFDFYGRGPYRPAVPRPGDLLGYEAGARHTQYAQQQAVLDQLIAAAGERVRAESIGTTEEGRVMRVLIISAPENIARLDEVRADLARLAAPQATTPAQATEIAARTPAAAFLSYSIHGNEPAGFEAVMWVAFHLLASEEPATTARSSRCATASRTTRWRRWRPSKPPRETVSNGCATTTTSIAPQSKKPVRRA